jgi:gas vesicle protein
MGQEPEQLRADIAQTRGELDEDLDRLADKVSPSKVVERRVDAVKGTIGGVRERVMGSAHDAAGSVASSGSGVMGSAHDAASGAGAAVAGAPDTVKAKTAGNPLAAGLIAFGVGWLAASLLPASSTEAKAAAAAKAQLVEPAKQQLAAVAQEVKDELQPAVQDAVASVKETATDAASTVKERTTESVDTVKEQAGSAAGDVTDSAKSAGGGTSEPAPADPFAVGSGESPRPF